MSRFRSHRRSQRRRPWREDGHFRWTFGVLVSAILLPILLATTSPLLAALIPGALLTVVGVHALEANADEQAAGSRALPAQLVSPRDVHEAHRIHAAIEIPSSSRRV